MTPQEARKLLGAYATGTLTAAEQEALFAAALEDQELFDELAREQSLRDLLADPSARATLLATLDEPQRRWWQSWRPWTAVAVMASAGVLAVSLRKPPAAPVEIARVEPPRPSVALPASPEPAAALPQVAQKRKAIPAPVTLPEAPKPEMAKNEAKTSADAVGGFAPAVSATPPPPPPPKAELREQVQVTAASPRLSFQDSAAVRVQPMTARTGTAPLALRYSIVRDDTGVRVRFTSTVTGYLSVGGATPVTMVLMQPYTTPALSGDEVKIVFARQPVADAPLGLAPNVEERGGEIYVTNTAQNEPLVFTISLKQP